MFVGEKNDIQELISFHVGVGVSVVFYAPELNVDVGA